MTIFNSVIGGGGGSVKVPLNDISTLSVTAGDTEATITWTDVGNLTVNGVLLNTWNATKLVRKVGSAPSNSSDGTLVLTETVADTYSSTGYTDTGLTNGTTYYYKAFSVGSNGLETGSNAESVTPAGGGLPAEYQEVEWIGSSGSQRIDTGVRPDDTTYGFECKINFTQLSGDWNVMNLGGTGTDYYRYGWGGYGNSDLQLGNPMFSSPRGINISKAISTGTDYTTIYNYNGDLSFVWNGDTLTTSLQGGSYTYGVNWNIFCQSYGSGSYTRYGQFKLYYMKIYHGTTLIRDFVPCYRKLDSVIGLYDLVNDVFYTNNGSGTFTKGRDIPGTGNIQGMTQLYSASFSGTTRGTRMSNDGTTLLVGEENGNRLTEYSLSTPFDVTTATEVTAITGLSGCQSACFNDNGTILTVGYSTHLIQYSCPTPYHLSGATATYNVTIGSTGLRQAFYVNNGNTLFVANDYITQYTTGSPYNPTNLTQVYQISGSYMGIAFNYDGTMYVTQDLSGNFKQYQAATPFNISSNDTLLRTESGLGQMLGICYTDDFYKLVFCNTSNQVKVYDLPNS